jgi:hypothetical protein
MSDTPRTCACLGCGSPCPLCWSGWRIEDKRCPHGLCDACAPVNAHEHYRRAQAAYHDAKEASRLAYDAHEHMAIVAEDAQRARETLATAYHEAQIVCAAVFEDKEAARLALVASDPSCRPEGHQTRVGCPYCLYCGKELPAS